MLVRAQVSACFAILRQRDPDFRGPGTSDQYGAQTTESLSDGSTRTVEGIAPGMEIRGDPGDQP